MTENPTALPISDPHRIIPVFVNDIVGSGQLNGVVNLTFATANFTPEALGTGATINADLVISCRLRMDFTCVQNLYVALGQLLDRHLKQSNDKPN